jgi:hypothetical protein
MSKLPVTEQELAAAAVAPRVTKAQIDALVAKLVCKAVTFEGTTSTLAIAMLDGFTVGIGFSACVNKENFNQEIGERLATQDALKKAENKLWELEGYRLHMSNAKGSK